MHGSCAHSSPRSTEGPGFQRPGGVKDPAAPAPKKRPPIPTLLPHTQLATKTWKAHGDFDFASTKVWTSSLLITIWTCLCMNNCPTPPPPLLPSIPKSPTRGRLHPVCSLIFQPTPGKKRSLQDGRRRTKASVTSRHCYLPGMQPPLSTVLPNTYLLTPPKHDHAARPSSWPARYTP